MSVILILLLGGAVIVDVAWEVARSRAKNYDAGRSHTRLMRELSRHDR